MQHLITSTLVTALISLGLLSIFTFKTQNTSRDIASIYLDLHNVKH